MKCVTLFRCEFCSAPPFETAGEAEAHEAAHFGLTVEEYKEWGRLTKAAEQAGYRVGCGSNPETRKAFHDAITNLCAFELGHRIPSEARAPRFI